MARINEEDISAIRAKADIVDIVGHYIHVEKSGRNYKALCPFHDDHDPSMTLNTQRQIFKCFVCGAGGNVFTFVQKYENVSFPESVVRVAEIIDYPLSYSAEEYSEPKDPHRQNQYRILNEMIRFTQYSLNSEAARREKEYLTNRGLDADLCNVFQIGYNPGGDSLYRFLHAKGYQDRDMNSLNIVRSSGSGMHDVFGGRITFPIHDTKGNPIGFSARTLDPNEAKYINTNETELFIKGNIVYNYHRARSAARHEGKVYVCEGVTDVIAFYRAGIENAVCTLGTACTDNQIRLLKGMAVRVVFCYDGDEPGQAAAWKAASLARSHGCEVAIIQNRTGKDPDEIIRTEGKEALRELVSRELSWMEFVIEFLSRRTNFDSYIEKREFTGKVQAQIATLNDETEKKYFTSELARITGFDLHYVPEEKRKQEPVQIIKTHVPAGIGSAEEQILSLMMTFPAASRRFEDQLGYLTDPQRNMLAMMILDETHSKGKIEPAELIDCTDDQGIKAMISKIAAEETPAEYDEKVMDGIIRKVKITYLEKESAEYRAQLSAQLNTASQKLLMEKYTECLRELRRYYDEENSSNV